MKFRTDFVTNSSDSNFLVFNVKNPALFDYLKKLGIRFEDTDEGEFRKGMKVILPSGSGITVRENDDSSTPFVDGSISEWLVAMLMKNFDFERDKEDYDEGEYEAIFGFEEELITILNNAGITHLNREDYETWSRDAMRKDLSETFDCMDGDITEAVVRQAHGFEGFVVSQHDEIRDGCRMSVFYRNEDPAKRESCENLSFAVTGELNYFSDREALIYAIEKMGGTVSDTVTVDSDYLICNDIRSSSDEMEKAKALGVAVLSETAFIRRFCNVKKFKGLMEEEKLYNKASGLAYGGDALRFVMENGTVPVIMEVWKDGKWTRNCKEKTDNGRYENV